MRKLVLSLLLATTIVTPAFSQVRDRDARAEDREQRRSERSEARKERSESREAARPERVERAEPVQQNVTVRERPVSDRNAAVDQRQVREQRRAANVNESGRPTLDPRRDVSQGPAAARQLQREQLRQQRQESRSAYIDRVNQRRVPPPPGASPDRPAPPPATVTHTTRAPAWHTTWRHDNRYDWRRWRDRNRSHFHLGFYFDPFGWDYRRWGIGWRLWPSYYSDRYWLDDPWSYRLPYAPWPYRWIRYYDDALLVNTMSGQVVDVIYDFFW